MVRIITAVVSTVVTVVTVAGVLAASGCATSPPGVSPTTAPPARTQEQPPAPATQAPPPEQPDRQWSMPNLVGTVLQDAQDQIQAVTGNPVFLTTSHDVSGRSRLQALDSNWKVCSQNVEPGAPLTADSLVDFGVVKLDETCP